MTEISDADFKFYQDLLLEKSGLSLAAEKSYLLMTRLNPVASSLGYAKLCDFTQALRKKDPVLIRSVVEAMTTNETSFFRDTKPFQTLKELLPQMMQARERQKTIRIWSAACSSGQESYSIAMIIHELFKDKPGWSVKIVATDISNDILAQAQKGEYTQFEVQRGLTIQMMMKYFTQVGTVWRIKDELRTMVEFKHLNLLESMAHLGSFDFIFCRNVLIYFNPETKARVLTKIAERMQPDGYLFLGACETIINLQVPLMSQGLGLFQLKDRAVSKMA